MGVVGLESALIGFVEDAKRRAQEEAFVAAEAAAVAAKQAAEEEEARAKWEAEEELLNANPAQVAVMKDKGMSRSEIFSALQTEATEKVNHPVMPFTTSEIQYRDIICN